MVQNADNIQPGASAAAYDERMISRGIDLSYLGVVPLWTRDLGNVQLSPEEKKDIRLIEL